MDKLYTLFSANHGHIINPLFHQKWATYNAQKSQKDGQHIMSIFFGFYG